MKKYNLIFRNNGFSEISFPVSAYQSEKDILRLIIRQLFIELRKISKSDHSKVYIIAKFKYADNSIRSLHSGKVLELDNNFIKRYLAFIKSILDLKSNNYDLAEAPITNILFNFFIVPEGNEEAYNKFTDLNVKITNKVELERFNVNEKTYLLPNNMDYSSWGSISLKTESVKVLRAYFSDQNGTITINKIDNLISYIEGPYIIHFTDYVFKDNIFIRDFRNGIKFYIKNGKIILKTKEIKTEFIKKLKTPIVKDCKIGTLDIETIVKNDVHHPYLFALHDGQNSFSWFESDATKLFEHILSRKYTGYTFYAHNLSRFDIVFLFKDIAKLNSKGFSINYLKKEDKVIAIKIYNTSKKLSITLKDSILLLPISLAKLSKQFNLEIGKLIQPVYVGPDYEEYKDSDLSHFNKEVEQVTNFVEWKSKASAYCIQDCVALYQVLIKFRELILNKFNIDIVNCPTTPSLAFAIYKLHYMPKDTIPITKGHVFNFIKQSYTGGSTEMYKPLALNKKIFCYDVNSLYPAVMCNNEYPTGNIIQFEGDPTILDNYWIGQAKVSTKSDLYQPYLQIHHRTKAGMRTNKLMK